MITMDHINIKGMKLIFLIIGFTLVIYDGRGQQWNLDFEEWNDSIATPDLVDTIVKDRVGIYPSGWYSNPDFIPEGKGIGQTTDAKKNEFAVALSGFYQFEVMRIMTGTSPNDSGWPIDYFPKELNGFYKAILPCSTCDSLRAYVDVYLTNYDTERQIRDTIGQGHIILKETADEYKNFNMAIDYAKNNELVPDTITIVLAKERFGFGSQSECWECSHVFFDDFTLPSLTLSIDENENVGDGFECYPNPLTGQITIKNNSSKPKFIYAFNILGSLIFKRSVDNISEVVLQTKHLPFSILFVSDGKTTKKILIINQY